MLKRRREFLHRLIQTVKDGNILRGYRYDSFGNRTEKTEGGVHTRYAYNSLNQLIQDTDGLLEHRYEYDNRGNLVKTLENGTLQHAYEFGAMNRMTRAVDGMGNVAEYAYNGLGHRTGMRQGVIGCPVSQGLSGHRTEEALDFGADNFVLQTPEVWSKETAYILDFTKNYHNLLQKEERGNVQSYIWDSEVLFMEENGERYSYLNDMQGSAMRLLNHGGEDVISYRYDEFGTDLLGNQGQLQPFGYTGYQRDTVAGTYYAQAREYDAWSGRFTGEDVVKGSVYFPISINRYLYCQNQPINYIDLNGLSREDAREYMKEYGKEGSERNSDYPAFSNNCANFVSQSLMAGGVKAVKYEWFCSKKVDANQIEKWILKLGSAEHRVIGNNVYYNATDKKYDVLLSDTWNNADAQYKYFSNSENGYSEGDTIKISSYKELQDALKTYNIQTGDLLYWDDEGDGNANHATIISKVDDGLYYAGNTSNRFDEKVIAEQFKKYKCLYIVHLKDEVFKENACSK